MSPAVLYRCTHAAVASSRSAEADSGPAGNGEPSRMHSVLIRLPCRHATPHIAMSAIVRHVEFQPSRRADRQRDPNDARWGDGIA
jgi:hypothetical protein